MGSEVEQMDSAGGRGEGRGLGNSHSFDFFLRFFSGEPHPEFCTQGTDETEDLIFLLFARGCDEAPRPVTTACLLRLPCSPYTQRMT